MLRWLTSASHANFINRTSFCRDPVVAKDGRTYERSAISKWLETNKTSPMVSLDNAYIFGSVTA